MKTKSATDRLDRVNARIERINNLIERDSKDKTKVECHKEELEALEAEQKFLAWKKKQG